MITVVVSYYIRVGVMVITVMARVRVWSRVESEG